MTIRSATSKDAPPKLPATGSDGPAPAVPSPAPPAFEIELNGRAAGATPAGIAATGGAAAAATDPDVVNGGGAGRGAAVATGVASGGEVAAGAGAEGIDAVCDPAAGTWEGADDVTLENACGGAEVGVAACGSAVAAGDFGAWLETEPNDCAITGPARAVSSVATRAAAVMR